MISSIVLASQGLRMAAVQSEGEARLSFKNLHGHSGAEAGFHIL